MRKLLHSLKLHTIFGHCNTLYLHSFTLYKCNVCHRYIVDLFIFVKSSYENMCVHYYDDSKWLCI